jgi:hypothetical protein
MGVYAFCPVCEAEVLAEFSQAPFAAQAEFPVDILVCGRCFRWLNLHRWVRVRFVPSDRDENRLSLWAAKLLDMVPTGITYSRFSLSVQRLFGCYLVPGPIPGIEVPEIVESLFTQIAKYSGLPLPGISEDQEVFWRSAVRVLVNKGLEVNAR